MLYNIYNEFFLSGIAVNVAIDYSLVEKMAEAYLRGNGEIRHNGQVYSVGSECFHIYEVPTQLGDNAEAIRKYFDDYANKTCGGNYYERVFSDYCEDVTQQFLKGLERGDIKDYYNIYIVDSPANKPITLIVLDKNQVQSFLRDWSEGHRSIWVDGRFVQLNKPKGIRIFDIRFKYLTKNRGDIKEYVRKIVRGVHAGNYSIQVLESFGTDVTSDWNVKPFKIISSPALKATKSFSFDWSMIHSRIAEHAKPRFITKQYADAVEASFKEINDIIKSEYQKIKRFEKDGDKLMKEVFSVENGLFKLADLSSETGKSIQQGYMEIFAGAMKGIRNPKAHKNLVIDEIDAWEKIVLASHLMKMWDNRLKENEKPT